MPFAPRFSLVVLLIGLAPAGAVQGHRGNALYGTEAYAEAAERYAEGLESAEAPGVLAALANNLGLALARQEQPAEAAPLFEQAAGAAPSAAARASALYNGGVVAAQGGDLRGALEQFRRALLADPTHAHAAFNHEWVQRQLQSQAESDAPETPDPSAFAQSLKARADTLVARQRYRDALDLMETGLEQDSTVAAYADFTARLGEVVQIEETAFPADSTARRLRDTPSP